MQGVARTAAVTVVLLLPMTAFAFGWRSGAWVSTAYYYPVPVVYGPVYPAVVDPCAFVVPQVPVAQPGWPSAPAGRPYAAPSAAPASPTGPAVEPPRAPSTNPAPSTPMSPANPAPASEPPRSTGSPGPAVSESRSFYNAYTAVSSSPPAPSGDRARIGFWNLTDREVTLTVGNQAYFLPRNKSLKLDLPRRFVWKVGDREPQTATVPDQAAALEIVIRR